MCVCVLCVSKRVIACGVSAPTTGFGSLAASLPNRVSTRACACRICRHTHERTRVRTVAVGAAYASLVSRRHARDRQREERRRARSPANGSPEQREDEETTSTRKTKKTAVKIPTRCAVTRGGFRLASPFSSLPSFPPPAPPCSSPIPSPRSFFLSLLFSSARCSFVPSFFSPQPFSPVRRSSAAVAT